VGESDKTLYNYSMFSRFKKARGLALDILFPPLCINCAKNIEGMEIICSECFSLIHTHSSMFCPICDLRLLFDKRMCNHGQEIFKKHPYFLAPATNYDDPLIQNLIYYLKYKSFKNISPILGKILENYLKSIYENCKLEIKNYILVPIPLHPKRQKQRGFNQSELLAKFLSERFNIPIISPLKRIKETKPQAQFNKSKNKNSILRRISKILKENEPLMPNYEKRRKNISGAFLIINSKIVRDKNIILIDDVYTSGATMSEASILLKNNGANKIIALVVAKA